MSGTGKNIVFLLGAGRSGTTLLYKILSLHRSVAYLSNYQKSYPNWPSWAYLQFFLNQFPVFKRRTWFMEKGNAYFNQNRKWIHTIVPTPSEAESVYASCGIPLTPSNDFCLSPEVSDCLRNKFEHIRKNAGGEILLSKRTANNRRISLLKKIFPDAKYIHLIRDGRAVAYSALQVAWWNDHLLYWAGRTPRQMKEDGFNPLELAARNWVEEMKSLESGTVLLQKNQLLEIQYDELLRYPHEKIQDILNFMGVTSQKDTVFWNTLETLQLAPKHERWVSSWTESELNIVHNVQQEALYRWGFDIKSKVFRD